MRAIKDVQLPRRMRKGDAGYDFVLPEDITFHGDEIVALDTGIAMEKGDIPENCVMLLFPRSSLGTRYGLSFTNVVGVIDSGYRDTIRAHMRCTIPTSEPVHLTKGTRFMQGVIVPFMTIPGEIEPEKDRDGGFGSTDQ